jgi:DMSO/TMAO reductase YedYZ molybdopterin-dependent catalytic subunit
MTAEKTKLQWRTAVSFVLLLSFLGGVTLLWMRGFNRPDSEDIPAAFRTALELNGVIWKQLFNSQRQSECTPPRPGKIPRVNGDVGLNDDYDPARWSLELIGDDQDPKSPRFTLTMQDIRALPVTKISTEFKCIEGWSEEMSFAGVKFSDLILAYKLKPHAYVGLATGNGEYYVSIDWESMMHGQTLLAFSMNDRPLKIENGAPLRLLIPVKYGIKNLKRVGKIFLSDKRPPDYWAERGYDWYAGL